LDQFRDLSPDTVEAGVRAEFDRWSMSPVQDFVAILVERSMREKLRAEHNAANTRLRKSIGKAARDRVTVSLSERLD
jgi:hypothetical protein